MDGSGTGQQVGRRLGTIAAAFFGVLVFGTLGYRLLSEGRSSWIDCLYMTVITVTTIGFGEIVDMSVRPEAVRVFTIFVALSGIGIITYVMTSITFFAVDGELRAKWRKRRMEKELAALSGHYVLCGWCGVAQRIVEELEATQRDFVVITDRAAEVRRILFGDEHSFHLVDGEPTDDALLRKAGIERAAGVFAVDEHDHANVVACLTARQLNPGVRIVACVVDQRSTAKMKRAGADAVVSAVAIGGMRMASEMVRPAVVSFLDTMLRDREAALRVEEVPLAPAHAGRAIRDLGLAAFPSSLLLAVKTESGWRYHPPADHVVRAGDVLIVMTTPAERTGLRQQFSPPEAAPA